MTLSVSAVDYRIGDFTILDRVTAEASQGEVVGLVGPNGAGKSTLANVITGIVHPTGGQVTLDGKILPWRFQNVPGSTSRLESYRNGKPDCHDRCRKWHVAHARHHARRNAEPRKAIQH